MLGKKSKIFNTLPSLYIAISHFRVKRVDAEGLYVSLHKDRYIDDHDLDNPRIALLLNNPHSETAPLVAQYLNESDVTVDVYLAYKSQLPEISEYDGLIAAGSDYNVRDLRHTPWLQAEEELYRKAECPVLAICFGHQVLAESYGGKAEKAESYTKIMGANKVHLDTKDPLFNDMPPVIYVAEEHADEVVEVPEEFEVIAFSDVCNVEAIRHKKKPIYGVQFHPEWESLMNEHGRENFYGFKVLDNYIGIVKEEKALKKKIP